MLETSWVLPWGRRSSEVHKESPQLQGKRGCTISNFDKPLPEVLVMEIGESIDGEEDRSIVGQGLLSSQEKTPNRVLPSSWRQHAQQRAASRRRNEPIPCKMASASVSHAVDERSPRNQQHARRRPSESATSRKFRNIPSTPNRNIPGLLPCLSAKIDTLSTEEVNEEEL